jgi:acyl-CoA dehydrogenase
MEFEFPEELEQLRETARSFLIDQDCSAKCRRAIVESQPFDRELWRSVAELGWLAPTIPESYGGLGLGHLAACVLAEELGRAMAPLPFSSSVYLATEAILRFASPEQQARYLPKLASGELIGTFAYVEGSGPFEPRTSACAVIENKLHGTKLVVADGLSSDIAIVTAKGANGEPGLFVVNLADSTVSRSLTPGIDPSRPHATITFDDAPFEPLPGATTNDAAWEVLNRAAALMAFEQLGVASAALAMASEHAKHRYAFGRPIGSFQAIKHKLVDVYVAVELGRSNCFFAGWALEHDAPELPVAAAAARVSASDAAWLATKENIQTHGGMGFTWELDCHLYYRRAKALALALGGNGDWKRRLIAGVTELDGAGTNIAFATGELH